MVVSQAGQIEALTVQLAELRAELGKNWRNSSSDRFARAPGRVCTGRRPGRQPGARGRTAEMVAVPDPADPVFISDRQKDGTCVASELAWLLRAAGISIWRDRDDLPPGDTEARLKQAIAAGISGGVLVTTPDVVNSGVVKTLEAPQLLWLENSLDVQAAVLRRALMS